MANDLEGRKVAVLVDEGFEQVELTSPVEALEERGATAEVVAPRPTVRAWNHREWGRDFDRDVDLEMASADAFDALLLPGGVMSPDRLRTNPAAVKFVRDFFEAGKPVAALCHGPWTLIDAGVVDGREVTSYRSLSTDLANAGARWVDREVVVDQGLVTSRTPDDLPAFNRAMVEVFSGSH